MSDRRLLAQPIACWWSYARICSPQWVILTFRAGAFQCTPVLVTLTVAHATRCGNFAQDSFSSRSAGCATSGVAARSTHALRAVDDRIRLVLRLLLFFFLLLLLDQQRDERGHRVARHLGDDLFRHSRVNVKQRRDRSRG